MGLPGETSSCAAAYRPHELHHLLVDADALVFLDELFDFEESRVLRYPLKSEGHICRSETAVEGIRRHLAHRERQVAVL